MGQLPSGSAGAVAVSLTIAAINILCCIVVLWLTWQHERWSYVALFAVFAILAAISSVTQQVHTATVYSTLVIENARRFSNGWKNAENVITFGEVGFELVTHYIRTYAYSVEAMLVMFWSLKMGRSVFKWKKRNMFTNTVRQINYYGKTTAVALPAITTLLLRVPAVNDDYGPYLCLLHFPIVLSLTVSIIMIISILFQYVVTRRQFKEWNLDNDQSESSTHNSSGGNRVSGSLRHAEVYDRWLLLRFILVLAGLSAFELVDILFSIQAIVIAQIDHENTPNLSTDAAKQVFTRFIPGNIPGILLLLIFSSTAAYRKRLRKAFVPRCWQRSRAAGEIELPDELNPSRHSTFNGASPVRQHRATMSVERKFVEELLGLKDLEPAHTADRGSLFLRREDSHRSDSSGPVLPIQQSLNTSPDTV